jgi:hypothetical protein
MTRTIPVCLAFQSCACRPWRTQEPDAEGRVPGCSGMDVSRQFLDDGLVRLLRSLRGRPSMCSALTAGIRIIA